MQKCSCEKRYRRTNRYFQPLAERRVGRAWLERLRAIQAGKDHSRGVEPRANGNAAEVGSLRGDRRGAGNAGGSCLPESGTVAIGST